MSPDVCPCLFCRTGRELRAFVTSDTGLLLIAAAMLGILITALVGGWGGILG